MARLLFISLVLASVLTFSKCSFYYHDRPLITIQVGTLRLPIIGVYVFDYASRRDLSSAELVVMEDANFGCESEPRSSNYSLPAKNSYFVVMVPITGNSPCSEYRKAVAASEVWGASGIIYYYTPDDPRGGKLSRRPSTSLPLKRFSVTKIELTARQTVTLFSEIDKGSVARVSITTYSHPLQTTQTFYFIIFAFCILMILSCLWFVMSYLKRCHYSIKRRRRRVRGFLMAVFVVYNTYRVNDLFYL